jgi:dTDP-4-amino-4,6-dideoxygalactose transaminase
MSEIITVAHTFIATVEAVKQAGYRPVFVDIDPDTCLMDPGQIEAAITPRTRAIIPVHLYGQMTPMAAVMEIANRHGLVVIEDAAQAHGALWQGKGPGAWGHAATFSFYPGKNLGAWGDAGAVFTRDEALATRMRMRANHGRMSKYEHEIEGMNSRLDGIQAAILRAKLPHLSEWNAARRQAAGWYAQELKDVPGLKTPVCHAQAQHVYHLYVVQLEQQRDEVMRRMLEQGIEVGVHYPVPLHRQPALRYLGYDPRCFPITNRVAETILSLPLYPEITRQQVQTVAGALKSAMQGVD